ncbi:tyrosine-type recombinase/integrase [Bacillus subtilis]|nr:tyrosine-type recombinase/integrase [Bacillus subtilis]TYS11729.1 tyrosine-type recombinase/integrase [Bacillus subtilis]
MERNIIRKRTGNYNTLLSLPNSKGKDFGPYAINKVIDEILGKTDLHHITPHDLRHTHAIMLLESGADLKYVSERLGHTTVNMTADVYIHITKKHNKKSIDQFEECLNA